MSRRLAAVGAVVGVFLLAPTTAGADPATPTHYRSRVTSSPEGVEVTTVGGDAFLRLRAARGREVVVLGYSDEPWLRISPDGAVDENRRSPAAYLNRDRYADVPVPESADPEAQPTWTRVGTAGEWTWHDHRIHWMSPDLPPVVQAAEDEATRVFTWNVALLVDGREEAVWGTLTWLPAEASVPWLASGMFAGLALAVVGRASAGRLVPFVLGAALVAAVIGYGEIAAQPGEASETPTALVLGGLAGALAVASVAALRRWPARARHLSLAALGLLVPWVVVRLEVFTAPVLPTSLPAAFDRVGTAVVAWVIAGSIALVAHSFSSAVGAALNEPPRPEAPASE